MPPESLADRRSHAAHTQSTFREVNKQIARLSQIWGAAVVPVDYICECLDPACCESIAITRLEYERVRAHPARFFVAPGHEVAEIESTVERTEGFLVVEKLGTGGEVAEALERRYDSAA